MSNLSYWEKSIYFQHIDVAIIGAGIVGLCTGLSLLERDPDLRILILERNYLPLGASTKNAGFACFGSPSELLDDLKHTDESTVFSLFKKRYDGIQKLLKYTGTEAIDSKNDKGFELIHSEYSCLDFGEKELLVLNDKIFEYTQLKNYFYFDNKKLEEFNLQKFHQIVANDYESSLHPVKMMLALTKLFTDKKGKILYGAKLMSWIENETFVRLKLQDETEFQVKKTIFCTNGFAKKQFPFLEIQAARNMVMLLKPKTPLQLKGCFHVDRGYYYFRDLNGNLLIGGGRQLDLLEENTDEFGLNEKIKSHILDFANENILQTLEFEIIDQWSGIMGLGPVKKPIVEKISNHISVAVRLGGMGIAIGSLVGDEAAELIFKNIHESS